MTTGSSVISTIFSLNKAQVLKAHIVFSFATQQILFLKIFGGHKSFLWGHWNPYFGLLVMSPLGFKARVSALFPEIHLWFNTCWPLGGQHGSQTIFSHVPVSRHWWNLKLGSIMWQKNALRTELCRLNIYYYCLIHSFNFLNQQQEAIILNKSIIKYCGI